MSVDINYLKIFICILHRARFDRPPTLTQLYRNRREANARKREDNKGNYEMKRKTNTAAAEQFGRVGPKSGDKM